MSEREGSFALLARNLRTLPREAWILFIGAFVNRFGSFVLPFLVLYMRDEGFSVAQAGLAASAYGLGGIGAASVGGLVADRLGRRAGISISMFTAAGAMLLLSQAESLWLIVLLVAVTGMTAEMYRPASSALLADVIPESQRVAAFSIYRLFINVGFAAGPAVGGFLAGRSYFYLFLGDAITSALFGVIALTALPKGTRSSRTEERRGEGVRTVIADRPFVLFLVATFFVAFVYAQQFGTLALHVTDAGLSKAVYGVLISLNGVVVVLLELPLIAILQRRDARTVLMAATVLTGTGFALTGLFSAAALLAMTVTVWTLGEIFGGAVSSAYTAQLAPAHLRGRYNGALGMTYAVAFMIAPAAGGAIYGVRPAGVWALCLLLGVAAAVMLAASRPRVPASPRI